jgi:hypothetical protein
LISQKKKEYFLHGFEYFLLCGLGAAGEVNFLTGEEGWGFEEKSTQKFLHSGKKKKNNQISRK